MQTRCAPLLPPRSARELTRRPSQRGSLLGERQPAPPPDVPKSVFDYLSAKSRERLATLTSAPGAPGSSGPSSSAAGATSAAPSLPEPDEELFVPPLDRPTAQAALRGFQPYSAASTSPDPVKQARYTLYLQYQASGTATTTSSPFGPRTLPSGKQQTVSELNRELNEYAQAARVFKPVGGMLGSRFQSSVSGSLDVPKVEPGLYQPPPKADKATSSGDALRDTYGDASASANDFPPRGVVPEPQLTPAQQAARAGNFGPGTTRTTKVFRPARLLCKRFGVRDPHERAAEVDEGGVGGAWGEATAKGWGGGAQQQPGAAQPVGEGALEEMMRSAGFQRFQAAAADEARVGEDAPEVAKGPFEARVSDRGQPAPRSKARPTIETVGYGDDEAQGREILEEKRAPQDIFAAIFADSDDDDDDDDNDEDGEQEAAPAVVVSVDPVPPTSGPAPAPPAAEAPPTPLSLDTLTSYKPSFVPTSSRTGDKNATKEQRDATDKKKKPRDKKKRSRAAVVGLSFDLDEGGEGEGGDDAGSRKKVRREKERDKGRDRDKEKVREKEKEKRPRKDKAKEEGGSAARVQHPARAEDEDDDEWAEAPSRVHPDVLRAMAGPTAEDKGASPPHQQQQQGKAGRMKAADLY